MSALEYFILGGVGLGLGYILCMVGDIFACVVALFIARAKNRESEWQTFVFNSEVGTGCRALWHFLKSK